MLAVNLLKQYASFPFPGVRALYTCSVLERARKGTRMRKEALKKKRKKETIDVQKKAFVPYKQRLEMKEVGKYTPRKNDDDKDYPIDNVYLAWKYKWPRYTVSEAVALLAETQHPSQYNNPGATVMAHVELSMAADKKNQFVREFSNVILYPHHLEVGNYRTTLAICTDEDMVEEMREFGVTFPIEYKQAVKMAKKGEIDFKKYNHIISHSSLLPELIDIRAHLGKDFPSPRLGTASHDVMTIARRFVKGIEYCVQRDKIDQDFGKIDISIGTLEMESDQIEANLTALMLDIEQTKPKARSKDGITLVNVYCLEFDEHFVIDYKQYLPSPPNEEEKVQTEL